MLNTLLFTGNSNLPLARQVAERLRIPLGKATVSKFKDGEVRVEYLESVCNKDVVLLQSTSAPQDANLMELLLLADAALRGSAKSITAIVPYFGYARQDRCRQGKQEPISVKLIASLLKASGIQRFVTISLHSAQTQGFFEMPVYNLDGHSLFTNDVAVQRQNNRFEDFVVVSPDSGGVTRARAFAKEIGDDVDLAFINKVRPVPNVTKVFDIIGKVGGKSCILIDDMIDTGGTLISAAKALKDSGANKVVAYCTHPVLSGSALDKIENSLIDELVITNTIDLPKEATLSDKIRQFSVAPMISKAILKIFEQEEVREIDFKKKLLELSN